MANKQKLLYQGYLLFWNGFIKTLTWITQCLGWKVGDGLSIKLDFDPIIGLEYFHIRLNGLRYYLSDYGLHTGNPTWRFTTVEA